MILTYQARKCSPEGICFTLSEYIPLVKVWTCWPILWSVGWGVSRRYCRSCFIWERPSTTCTISQSKEFLTHWNNLLSYTVNSTAADGMSTKGETLCAQPMRPRYIVTSSLIGWAHTQNSPWLKQPCYGPGYLWIFCVRHRRGIWA